MRYSLNQNGEYEEIGPIYSGRPHMAMLSPIKKKKFSMIKLLVQKFKGREQWHEEIKRHPKFTACKTKCI